MPTIFITLRDGEVSKNILQSDIFPLLAQQAHVVLLVPKNKFDFFHTQFGSKRISVEVFPPTPYERLEEAFADIFLYSLHTESIPIKIEHSFHSGGSKIGRAIKYTLWTFGAFYPYRLFVRLLYRLMPDSSLDALFAHYRPTLVFAANLTSMEDARLIKTARRYGTRSVGMPKGWDNLTLKTFLPTFPDRLLVQNELMQADAISLDYPARAIEVVGFPKFDVYADSSVILPREEFVRSLGLDPRKKLIVYAGAGDQLAPHDEEILADFLQAIDAGELVGRPQVVVRPHPKYVYNTERIPPRDFWVLDRPGKVLGGKQAEFEFDKSDVVHLANTLYHCDLLIHTASTLGIEAAIYNKPSITLAYDGHATLPAALSTARYYAYTHMRRVIDTGGMRVARNFEELLNSTREYLTNPQLDREARETIVRENAFMIDGKAGDRTAQALLALCR